MLKIESELNIFIGLIRSTLSEIQGKLPCTNMLSKYKKIADSGEKNVAKFQSGDLIFGNR